MFHSHSEIPWHGERETDDSGDGNVRDPCLPAMLKESPFDSSKRDKDGQKQRNAYRSFDQKSAGGPYS